jgi:hypothetical protein
VSVHAFVDESRRGGTYLVAVALVDPGELSTVRASLRKLCLPGQRRIHFKDERDSRRREILARILESGARGLVYSCRGPEPQARGACLRRMMADFTERGVLRLVLESRQGRDKEDERALRDVLGKRPSDAGLTYEHLRPHEDPLLWLPDAIAWCVGAGEDWRRRIQPLLDCVRHIDP